MDGVLWAALLPPPALAFCRQRFSFEVQRVVWLDLAPPASTTEIPPPPQAHPVRDLTQCPYLSYSMWPWVSFYTSVATCFLLCQVCKVAA